MDVHVTVVRVFCGAAGDGGNQLGVLLDGASVSEDDRQGLAAFLGYSETVFVDDPEHGRVRIFTPEIELPLAGHPLVGTGWLLAQEGYPAATLETKAGTVPLRQEDDGSSWAAARAEWCPPFDLIEHSSPAEVEALEPAGEGWRYEWAWIDETEGLVRARCFVSEAGIPEDEATGSAAIRLCNQIGRPIEVHQGEGSLIHARPLEGDRVEIGGIVVLD